MRAASHRGEVTDGGTVSPRREMIVSRELSLDLSPAVKLVGRVRGVMYAGYIE